MVANADRSTPPASRLHTATLLDRHRDWPGAWRTRWRAGQLVFYALGMGAVVSLLTVLFGLVGRGVLARVRGAGRVVQPLSAALLLATGGYIVYYWLAAGGG